MNLKQYRDICVRRLHQAGVFNPEAEFERIARVVFADAVPPLAAVLTEIDEGQLEAIVCQRERRVPLPRIVGRTMFYGLSIKVRPNVFRPYPESEALIEPALTRFCERAPTRILDLGSGTGCLLLALLKAFPSATGLGIDCDPHAVALASENASDLGLAGRAQFQIGDWTRGVAGPFDLIVSNPPRVPTKMIPRLLPEMRDHDPIYAFDGGPDGLHYFRRIAEDLARIAAPDAFGIFQASEPSEVKRLFEHGGYHARIELNYLHVPYAVSVVRP